MILTSKERAESLNWHLFHTSSHKGDERIMLIEKAFQEVRRAAFEEAADIADSLLVPKRELGACAYISNVSKAIRLYKNIK